VKKHQEEERSRPFRLGNRPPNRLACRTEHANQARKRDALIANAMLESNAVLAEPVQMPGLQYHQVRITGGQFEKFMVSQTTWWGFLYASSLTPVRPQVVN
jgi:protein-tyrosine phosphatase